MDFSPSSELKYDMGKKQKRMGRKGLCLILVAFLWLSWVPSSAPAMTIQEERELGEKVLQEVLHIWPLVQDPAVKSYVNRVGQKILTAIGPQPFQYEFYVLNTTDVNAFAVPGGKVFLNSGLILMVETEDELAAVIAHEMGHVVARHVARQSEQGLKLNLATLGAILAAIALGPQAASAVVMTSAAAAQTAMLKYSRENEEEADYLGLKFMDEAGYDRRAMLTVLKRIRLVTGPSYSDPPPYLLTHPALEQRMSNLEIQMAHDPREIQKGKAVGDLRRIQTELIVAEKDTARSIRYFENCRQRQPDNPECYLGLGLSHMKMGGVDRATENLLKAASLSPKDGVILRELGIAYFLQAQLGKAVETLERARSLSPYDGKTYFYLGRVYLEQKDYDEALQALQRAKDLAPTLPDIYYHLGMAYGGKGLLGPAYLNFGKHYKAAGDSRTALIHFRKALSYFPDQSPERRSIQQEIQSLETSKKPPRKEKK
jgi:predicted Zn-dependent protease